MPPPRVLMPISVGNDICHIPRITRILKEQPKASQFIRRILAPEELANPRTKGLLNVFLKSPPKTTTAPGSSTQEPTTVKKYQLSNAARFMAGRFAAKEAVLKAHPHRNLTWHRIVISRLGVAMAPGSDADASPSSSGQQRLAAEQTTEEEEAEKRGDEAAAPRDAASASSPSSEKPEDFFLGPPVALLKGDGDYEDTHAPVSISHDGNYATAVCIGYPQEQLRRADSE